MNEQTENSTQKSLEVISENNSVSVYSVNFTQVVNNPAEDGAEKVLPPQIAAAVTSDQLPERSVFSQKIFKWRNAIAVAAIFVIGVLHFTFQISFQNEISENRPVVEPPPFNESVTREPAREEAFREEAVRDEIVRAEEAPDSKPAEFEPKKIDQLPARKIVPAPKPRQFETAPARPQIRKKAVIETRTERLRRVERILTGV